MTNGQIKQRINELEIKYAKREDQILELNRHGYDCTQYVNELANILNEINRLQNLANRIM
jgi:uncharacterized coiled-coil protein SlyX